MNWKKLFEKKILLWISIGLILFICIVRSMFSVKTGFLVSDEAYYIHSIYGNCFNNRASFTNILWVYIKVVGMDMDSLLKYGSFFGGIFSIGILLVSWKISKLILDDIQVNGFVVFSFILMPIFMVMTPTFLTEAPALFFSLLGIYLFLLYIKDNKLKYLFLSIGFIIYSSFIRENYWYIFFANTLFIGFVSIVKKKRWLSILFIILLFFSILSLPPRLIHFLNLWKIFPMKGLANIVPRIIEYRSFSNIFSNAIVASSNLVPDLAPPKIPYFVKYEFMSNGIFHLIYVFLFGIFTGLNPIFIILSLIGMIFSIRFVSRRTDIFSMIIVFNMFVGFLVFAFHCSYFTIIKTSLYHVSTVFRFSHCVLYSMPFCLTRVYSLFSRRRRVGLIISVFLILIVMFPMTLNIAQSHFPKADRFSLDYKSPALRVYERFVFTNESILIFADSPRRISLYFLEVPNIYVLQFLHKEETIELLDTWNGSIYIYGEIVPEHFITIEQRRPFYLDLIRNETQYRIRIVWWDCESYFLEIFR